MFALIMTHKEEGGIQDEDFSSLVALSSRHPPEGSMDKIGHLPNFN